MAGNGKYSLLEIGRGNWEGLMELKEKLLQKEKEEKEKILLEEFFLYYFKDNLREKRTRGEKNKQFSL